MGINFKMEWDDDGFKKAVHKAADQALGKAATERQQKVAAMTCPTHGNHPEVSITNTGHGQRQIEAGGFCCKEFRDTVTAYLKSLTDDGPHQAVV